MAARTAHRPVSSHAHPRPLIVTCDQELLDDLLRIAEDAGMEVDVAADPVAARPSFAGAPVVLVGVDLADACVRARLRRHHGVVLVGRHDGQDAPPLWPVAEQLPAQHIAVLPAAEPWLTGHLREHRAPHGGTGRVVAVIGGRGGAGASVFAAGLAITASYRGVSTLLVDADPLGGGLDLLLGWEAIDGLRWPALSQTSGRSRSALAGRGAPAPGSAGRAVLRPHSPPEVPVDAMATTIYAGRRGRDLVVVDLPRRLDEGAALALADSDHAYLLVPAELRACAAAARVRRSGAALLVPGCGRRGPSPGGLTR